MILTRLCEYADRIKEQLSPLPIAFQERPIKWLIELDLSGNFICFISTSSGESKRDKGKSFHVPTLPGATSQTAAVPLVGNAEYVFGHIVKNEKRANERHSAFLQTLRDCASATNEPAVRAVLKFLLSDQPASITLPEELQPSDYISFSVQGNLPFQLPSVRKYWEKEMQDRAHKRTGKSKMQCIACGQLKPPATRHDIKIKGLPNAPTSGAALISANKPAFESFGLRHSLIAPVCQSCSQKYALALNHLLHHPSTHISIAGVAWVFWTQKPSDFNIATLLTSPDPDSVKKLLLSIRTAQEISPEPNDFYALSLYANEGRVALRSWMQTTLHIVQRNINDYFRAQRIVGPHGEEPRPIPLFPLCASLVLKVDRTDPLLRRIVNSILHHALLATPLPPSLLHLALRRASASQHLTQPLIAIIKLTLNSTYRKEVQMVDERLQTERADPAYLCGRLFAILESIQQSAVSARATIVSRFFGTASSAPASVFGNLMRLTQSHLEKLRNQKPGLYIHFQKQLEEVCSTLPAFPLKLTLPQQGLFALGYYHQRAYRKPAEEQTNSQ